MLDCPVCPVTNIKDTRCPQCKTDLTPLLRLRELPETYYTEGVILAEQGQLDKAIEKFSTAISLNPHSAAPYVALGNIYVRKDLFDEAIFQYQRALEINPEISDAQKAKESAEKARNQLKETQEKQNQKVSMLKKLIIGIPIIAFLIGFSIMPVFQNYFKVSPPIDYAAIAAQINSKIAGYSELAGSGVSVTHKGAEFQISGNVPTIIHKDLVEEIAKNVKNDININTRNLTITPAPVKSPVFSYTVKPNDTLSLIAYRFFDDSQMWDKIYNANRDLISNKNNIYVGQVLKIPIN